MAQMEMDLFGASRLIAGVDEAGRGPLAGRVYAAAVVLGEWDDGRDYRDSKTLSEKRREALEAMIQQNALSWSVAYCEVHEIDSLNILQATLLAMRRAVDGLTVQPHHAQVDGNQLPRLNCSVEAIVKGDQKIPAISAASILAKQARDRDMIRLEEQFPGYGFAQHKGYGTKQHIDAIRSLGPCAEHRRTFRPVSEMLNP